MAHVGNALFVATDLGRGGTGIALLLAARQPVGTAAQAEVPVEFPAERMPRGLAAVGARVRCGW
jgi:hypothetical protein